MLHLLSKAAFACWAVVETVRRTLADELAFARDVFREVDAYRYPGCQTNQQIDGEDSR